MKLAAFDHPKTLALKSALKCSLPTVIGHLELLWRFTSQHAPRGNIGKWPDSAIALACGWDDAPDAFINALCESGYVRRSEQYRLLIHDWKEHCPQWVRAQLSKTNIKFATEEPTEERSEEPSTIPSQAKPSQDNKNIAPDGAAFAEIQKLYPKREGAQRWADAKKHYNARIREGHTHTEILAGVMRYAAYCQHSRLLKTKLVQQAATFLGTNKGFLETWELTKERGAHEIPRKLSAVERVRAVTAARDAEIDAEEHERAMAANDRDLRPQVVEPIR